MTQRCSKISRRDLLTALPALAMTGALSPAVAQPQAKSSANKPGRRRIGLALGAGGANGLAHISMLEVLEGMNLRPHRIAGASIGAVIGAMYASGMSAAAIRKLVNSSFVDSDQNVVRKLVSDQAMHWLELVELEVGNGGLLDSQKILSHFYDSLGADRFSDLEIPLDIVAGDLWSKEQVVLKDGPLLPAVQASMAIPGVFEPVDIGGRVLIDGGTVNPVPWDLLFADCDIVIAIDVSGVRSRPVAEETGYFEILFNSIKVMQKAILTEKLRHRAPDILITPRIQDIRALEFYEAAAVFEQAEPAKKQLENELAALLAR
jgi:NTE family protein